MKSFLKNKISENAMKQVCIYGYPYRLLKKIPQNKKGKLEKDEDIEILRFLENNIKVKMIKAEGSKIAIDTRLDFIRAKKLLKK